MSDFGPPPPPDAGGPQYPGQPYPGQPYPGQPTPPARQSPFGRLGTRIGERLVRRPEPRFTVALAGAGVALTLVGILLWGGDYWGSGLSSGSSNRNLLGAALAAVVLVAGYILAVRTGRGPLGTAGVVAIGVGWPLTMGFLTLDLSNRPLPINFDAIFWVSLVGWMLTYLWVPGARGHTFFVFLIANGFYTYVLVKNISSTSLNFVSATSGLVPRFSGVGTIAAIGLCFGLAFYVIAFLLDRRGRHGPATALVYPAFNATATGIVAWSPDLHRGGAGVLAIVVGLAVCWYGGRYGRRVTCFAAAAAVVVGVVLLLSQATTDATTAGILFVVIGVLVVILAAAFAQASGEPDDMQPNAVVGSR
jgi:hypothetical protein